MNECFCFAENSEECVCSGAPPRCEECFEVLEQDDLDKRHRLCKACDPDLEDETEAA